jgi:hypothetical protein
MGVINLKDEVVDLFLEKLNDRVVSSRAAMISSFSVTKA